MSSPPKKADVLMGRAKDYSSFCTMAYQMYVTRLQYAYDPFYMKHGHGSDVQRMLQGQAKVANTPSDPKLDLISYNDNYKGIDLRQPTAYSGEVYFEPQPMAQNIGRVYRRVEAGEGAVPAYLPVQQYADKAGQGDSIDIYPFEGITGLVGERTGFPSTMGYVAYNKATNEYTVTFRGSRSGSAERGTVEGLFAREGNPDWVTDMSIAGDLVSRPEIIAHGKVAEGFSSTYLSCRPQIADIIAKIRSEHPFHKNPPKLVSTGHSLGGALATMMFIDTQKGLFGRELNHALEKRGVKDSKFIDGLMKGAECFAFSPPPVCDGEAMAQIGETDKHHRIYFDNDLVVKGGNWVRVIKGSDMLSEKEFLHNIRGTDINLGKFEGGNIGSPHELYLIDEELQKRLGKKPERTWYTLDENMKITHAAKKQSEDLSKQQAAFIASQFNYEYFLTLALVMAQREAHAMGKDAKEEKEKATDLIRHIEEIWGLLNKFNSCKDEKEFIRLREQLQKMVSELSKKTNEENSCLRVPNKAMEVLVALGKFVVVLCQAVLAILQGIRDWFAKDRKAESQSIVQAMQPLEKCCQKIMKHMVSPLDLKKRLTQAGGAQEYLESLINDLTELKRELDKFKKRVADNRETRDISEEINKSLSMLSAYIQATEEYTNGLVVGGKLINVELYTKFNVASRILGEQISGIQDLFSEVEKRWQKTGEYEPRLGEKLANIGMQITGFTFGVKAAIAKIVGGFGELCRTIKGIWSRKTTSMYMQETLGSFSHALEQTDFNAFKEARDNRKDVKPLLPLEVVQAKAKEIAEEFEARKPEFKKAASMIKVKAHVHA